MTIYSPPAACSARPGSTWCSSPSCWSASSSPCRWPSARPAAGRRPSPPRRCCPTPTGIRSTRAGRARAMPSWRCSGRRSSSRPGCCRRSTAARARGRCASASARPAWRSCSSRSSRSARHGGAGAAPRPAEPRPRRCRRCWRESLPSLVGHAGAGGGVLGRGQHLRRHPVHAVDVAVAGPLQAVRQPPGQTTRRCCAWPARRRSSAGLGGVLLAMRLPNVIGALAIFYSLLGVSLFVPIVGGLYVRRAGTPEALASVAAGIATVLALSWQPWAGCAASGSIPAWPAWWPPRWRSSSWRR